MNIALQGACPISKAQLYLALGLALKTAGWPVTIKNDEPFEAGGAHLTFLIGVDLGSQAQLVADQLIRATFARLNTSYDVLYGSTDEKVVQALRRIEKHLSSSASLMPDKSTRSTISTRFTGTAKSAKTNEAVKVLSKTKAWVWACDKCSDPECEHKLLTDLLAKRFTEPYLKTAADDQGA